MQTVSYKKEIAITLLSTNKGKIQDLWKTGREENTQFGKSEGFSWLSWLAGEHQRGEHGKSSIEKANWVIRENHFRYLWILWKALGVWLWCRHDKLSNICQCTTGITSLDKPVLYHLFLSSEFSFPLFSQNYLLKEWIKPWAFHFLFVTVSSVGCWLGIMAI